MTKEPFGFIAPDGGGSDVFVHVTIVRAAKRHRLIVGQRASFDVKSGERGEKAVNLRPA
jgi:CspA family cold shock protein